MSYQQGWRPEMSGQNNQPQQPQAVASYQQQSYQQPYQQPYQQSYQQPYQQPVQPVYQPQNVNANGQPGAGKSYFDGTLGGQIVLGIVNFLIIVFTFGICTPWAICRTQNWQTRHTVIEGRRLRFDGTAMGLFSLWIKWFLLCIITLGIYSLWVKIDLQKWIAKHTFFA